MNAFVVDTNVAVVANGRDTHASLACQHQCIIKLRELKESSIIVIDDCNHILSEYRKKLNFSGQPGVGDYFFKHVFDNQYVGKHVHRVSILRTDDGSFEEFPDDNRLVDFDNDDHMFVAVALTHQDKPPILNAVDTDWANYHDALECCGITILYLCPEHVSNNTNTTPYFHPPQKWSHYL